MFGWLIRVLKRQYYRYTVMTAIYMLGHVEAAILHVLMLMTFLFLLNYSMSFFNISLYSTFVESAIEQASRQNCQKVS